MATRGRCPRPSHDQTLAYVDNSKDFFQGRGSGQRSCPSGRSTNTPCNKIFVTGFAPSFLAEDLHRVFGKIGTVTNAYIASKSSSERPYAFVCFRTVEDAITAVNVFHLKPPLNLVVNFAKNREDHNSTTSADDESRSSSSENQRTKSKHRNQGNDYSLNKAIGSICKLCGKAASYRCSFCDVPYCSQKCQKQDWQSHMPQCDITPALVPICIGSPQSCSDKNSPFEEAKHVESRISKRIPSDHSDGEIVKEIPTPPKLLQASVAPHSSPARPVNNQSLETNPNEGLTKRNQSPLFLLLNELRKPNPHPSKPWQSTEILQSGIFVEVNVVHICKDSSVFYANLVDRLQISLDIMKMANDDTDHFQSFRKIKAGSLCLVLVADLIYRGVVETTSPYSVRLLDFGYVINAAEEEIFIAPKFFREFPAQALCMTPAPGENINLEEFDHVLIKYTGEMSGEAFIVKFKDNGNKQAPPSMIKEINSVDPCKELLNKCAEPVNLTAATNKSVESAVNLTVVTNGNVRHHPTLKRSSANLAPKEQLSTEWTRSPELPAAMTEVSVTHIDGPDIFVNICANVESICHTQLVAANNSPNSVPMQPVSPGSLCIVPFEGVLYRAKIKSVNPITAYLLDYGNTVTVSSNEVFCATNVQASAESQAIRVRLAPGSNTSLEEEQEVQMKALYKVGDVYIAQLEGVDDCQISARSISPAANAPNNCLTIEPKVLEKPKKHALDYLEQNMSGNILIQGRPCSNKFCLNIDIPELTSLHKKLVAEIEQFMKGEKITNPNIGEEVIVELEENLCRAEVLAIKKGLTYVALTDLGKVIRVSELFLLRNPTERKCPPLSVLGKLLRINGDKIDFESHIKNDTPVQFQVRCISETVQVECKFANMKYAENGFLMELTPWEPTWEQLHHGRIYYPDIYDCSVFITHFADPHEVYIRDCKPELDKVYNNHLVEIAKYSHTAKPLMATPVISESVLAKSMEDNLFYKAVITDVNVDKVTVTYVAFGSTGTVKLDDLRELCDNLKSVSLFVRKVALADVPFRHLTLKVANMMNDITKNVTPVEFKMMVDKERKVHLSYPNGKFLNKELAHLLKPIWHDLRDLPTEQAKDALLNKELLMENLIQLHEIPIGEAELYIIDVSSLNNNVLYTSTFSFDTIAVYMHELRNRITDYAQTLNIPYKPRVGELCIAKFNETEKSDIWLRGKCVSTDKNECCIVSVDMGLLQYIPIRNIRRMSMDFIEMPALSAICSIQGLPEGPVETEVLEILCKELVPLKSKVKFSNITKCSDGGYTLQLCKRVMDTVQSLMNKK